MPIYVYAPVDAEGCEECRGGMDVLQSFRDAPLTECPHCGCAIQRVPARFAPGKPGALSSSNLKEHGFKKLKRTDEGGYVDVT